MKFFAIASGVAFAITSVAAQLTAPAQNYNVSSPVSNAPYVMGQILPCTIQLFENVSSDIQLSISLDSAAAGSNVSLPIATNVDVSKTTASAKQNGNVTFYEHSVNYNIPTNIIPGAYKVVFLDARTNSHLDVPITVLPVASASVVQSPVPTGGSVASPSSSSGFKPIGSGVASTSPSTKAIASLIGVAAFAFML
ncbi:unnamed protein product [Mucor hiemalis]